MNGKKSNHTKRSARTVPQKLYIEKGARGLTTQAGLIPVAQFLRKHNILSLIEKALTHERGASALYNAADWYMSNHRRYHGWCQGPDRYRDGLV